MIQLTPHMRILVAVEPADFRKGIDGLAEVCRNRMRRDPFDGAVFVFRNRRATAVKILVYDGQGFWLCQKRLSKGRFRWWPARPTAERAGGYESRSQDNIPPLPPKPS
ncbi:MAG TPA: IS66 family insertion sequence element accessory protein TnpB [Dongiaceae bacterium]|nr:IS66 family insertion sequence element accessory protein TnpB [Dongiaceae bacterium]